MNDYIDMVNELEKKFAEFITLAKSGDTCKKDSYAARKFLTSLKKDLTGFRSLSTQHDRNNTKKRVKTEAVTAC